MLVRKLYKMKKPRKGAGSLKQKSNNKRKERNNNKNSFFKKKKNCTKKLSEKELN